MFLMIRYDGKIWGYVPQFVTTSQLDQAEGVPLRSLP